MSLQELHVKALEQQVADLTRDCYYLLSLINDFEEIDWDSWQEGQKIRNHLERSKDFFKAMKSREQYLKEREQERQQQEKRLMEQRRENARKAAEYLKAKAVVEEYERANAYNKQKTKEQYDSFNNQPKFNNAILYGLKTPAEIQRFLSNLFDNKQEF